MKTDSKRPTFMKTGRRETVQIKTTITVPREIWDKIEWLANKNDLKIAWMLRKLLQEALKNYPDPEQPELPL